MAKKSPKSRNTYANQNHQILRSVVLRANTLDVEKRSVEVVVATENPVQRYDAKRGTVIDEILRMDGVEFRTSRRQLPIVDSHDHTSTENVLGSVRNLRTDGDELVGDAVFASDERSQTAFDKLRDGHLTDFSITATPNEIAFVERGDSYSVGRQTVNGPAEIVTRWQPTDASLVATGADERSTVRSSLRRSYDLSQYQGDDEMNAALKTALIARGLPEDATDEQAIEFVEGLGVAVIDEPAPEPEAETPEEETPETDTETPAEAVDRALKADRSRQREIRALCTAHKIERQAADKLCDDGVSLDIARAQILDSLKGRPVGTSTERVEVTRSHMDKTESAMRDGLIKRAATATSLKIDPFKGSEPAEGHQDFQHMPLHRMAQELLEAGGISTRRMTARDIASVAMGNQATIQRLGIRRDGEAYHVTGTFANLLQDAANKTLLMGYDEAPYTWTAWARQAASVSDFKSIKKNRFSEAPDLDVVPENTAYPEGVMSDDKETYSIEKYGQIFSVSWETVVNDDLDAISRVPAMHGNAARRTQNKKVYEVLTANAAMADTGALFNTTAQTTAGGHANEASSGGAPTVASLNTAFVSMMTKKGLNSSVTINVQPRYLIVPAALAATGMQLLGSIADPTNAAASTEDATRPNYNSNTLNIYGPNGTRPLQLVADPVLDADSAVKWYLAADPGQIDTVELSFLAGEETPVLETEWEFDKDVYRYKIRQTFGVAPIDFRGLYYNPGA